jgi:hypothetical protein
VHVYVPSVKYQTFDIKPVCTECTRYIHYVPNVFLPNTQHKINIQYSLLVDWLTVGKHFCSILPSVSLPQHSVQKKLSVHNHYLMVCVRVPFILPCVTFLKHSVEIKFLVEKMCRVFLFEHSELKTHLLDLWMYRVFCTSTLWDLKNTW